MFLRRLVGFLLIIAALAGIIFSIAGLIGIWRYRPAVTKSVTDNLALFDQTLNTTQNVLTIVGQVVQTTTEGVDSLQTTTQALAQAIHSTNPMLDSLTSLTSQGLPAAVDAAQTSLASAQSSALLIDNVLAGLTSIPFSPVAAYKPAVPLHTALAQVSDSMNTLTPALTTINSSLAEGKSNLGIVEAELTKISKTTEGIGSTLGSTQTVITQYEAATTQLKANVEAMQRGAPGWLTTLAWIMSFVLGWFLIAQLGLAAQGFNLLQGDRKIK
jgi:hypothetical protein